MVPKGERYSQYFCSHTYTNSPPDPGPTIQSISKIFTELRDEQAEHDVKVNVELMKACFIELPKDKQQEVYIWIHKSFDYCRVYDR